MNCVKVISAGALLLGLGSASATETVTYTYDANGRLVQLVHSGTVNNGAQTTYAIDKSDNRTNKTTTGAP